MEAEGQQVARYLDGLQSTIWDRIGVQMVLTLNGAHNMALKAEMMT